MGRPWLLLSLPLLLVSLPCPALAQQCTRGDLEVVDSGGHDLQPVLTVTDDADDQKDQLSYLQPGEGFKGVSVELEGGRKMFFKTQPDCFSVNDTAWRRWWWQAEVFCQYVNDTHNIACHLMVGDCYLQCRQSLPGLQGLPDHRWVTHGPARWRISPPPKTCVLQGLASAPSQWDSVCRDAPAWQRPDTTTDTTDTTPNTTTNTTHTVDTAVATTTHQAKPLWVIAVVAVAVVVVVVMVVRHRKATALPYARLFSPLQAPAPGPNTAL